MFRNGVAIMNFFGNKNSKSALYFWGSRFLCKAIPIMMHWHTYTMNMRVLLNMSDDNSRIKIKHRNKESIFNDKCVLFFPKCYNLLTPLILPTFTNLM